MTELGVLLGLVEKFGQQWGWLVALVAVGAWLIRCRWVEHTPAEAQARKSDAEAGVVKADAYHRGMEASGGLIDKLMERNDRLVKRICPRTAAGRSGRGEWARDGDTAGTGDTIAD